MRQFVPQNLFAQAVLLFLLALGVRCVYLFGMGKITDSSHVEVEKAAVTWAKTGRLADAFGKNTGPTAHVPPLYTALLAGLHSTFGVESDEAVAAQRILATIVCSLGIALLPWIGRRCGLPNAAGVLAGVVLALYPFHIFIETYGRQETVYAVLLNIVLFGLWLRLRDDGWQGRGRILTLGVLTGVAALTAPQLVVFVGLALMGDFVFRREQRAQVFRAGLVVAGTSAVMIAPWVVRNFVELGGFVPLRSNLGLELYIGNHPGADGHTYTIPYSHPKDNLAWPHPFNNPVERQRVREIGELAYMKEKGDLARAEILAHPGAFIRRTGYRVLLYWFPPVSTWNPKLSARWPRSLAAWGLSLGCLFGLLLMFRERHPLRWPIMLALWSPSFVYLVTHVNVRYRYSSVWMMALLGGYAAVWVFCRFRLSAPSQFPQPSAARGAGSLPGCAGYRPSCSRDSAVPA